ncbi:hypothetical protein CU666_08200 [Pseudomonas syringae pv. actinidifoliorum]|nr:hypothetical protein [Pseudomonas syringae pv. actinidifoliorum]
MLAKTMGQTLHFPGLNRPIREQAKRRPARSHVELCINPCGSELAHEDSGPDATFSGAVLASSRASSAPTEIIHSDEGCAKHRSLRGKPGFTGAVPNTLSIRCCPDNSDDVLAVT